MAHKRMLVAKESKLKSLKQMRKFLLVFLAANAFCFSGSPISAEDNPFGKTVSGLCGYL